MSSTSQSNFMTNDKSISPDEDARLKNLHEYNIMDTSPEIIFDEITELASEILQCPVSFIQFMDEDRQWFKSKYGLPEDLVEMPRDASVCSTTICQNDLLSVPDLSEDARFSDLEIVKSAPNIRFYAGMPLITPAGQAIGTICTVDFEKKEITLNQQEAMRRLSHQVVTQLELRRTVIEMDNAIKSRDQMHEELAAEKARTEEMLLNILPKRIAAELKDNGAVEPRFYNSASIMFSDFSGFTKLAEQMQPKALIELLHQYFVTFDNIVARHNVEKLKTIGDAYMCAAGLPSECRGHAIATCFAALDIQNHMAKMNKQREKLRMPRWDMRIGIHSGPVISGVVGEKKFTYDIWGDAVNIAALMEQKGEPGRINVSQTTFQQINEIFETESRGEIDSGKKGSLAMYFVNRIKPEFSADTEGLKPNDIFEQKFGKLMRVYEN